MRSQGRFRPVTSRSWEPLSRLLDVMGIGSTREDLRKRLDTQVFLGDGMDPVQAEEMERLGAAAGVVVLRSPGPPPRLLVAGDESQLEALVGRLEGEGSPLASSLRRRLQPPRLSQVLELPGRSLRLDRPLVMGILNVTPDSFFDGGRYTDLERALRHAEELVAQGADVLDVGGESTRPGAAPVSEDEESARVIPLIETLARRLDVPLSIDTSKSGVARQALEAGAHIVNDVTGLRGEPTMASVVAARQAALVVMHMRGEPRTMQRETRYDSLMGEVVEVLEKSVEAAVTAGVARERILVDPGVGFAKTAADNLVLLKELPTLRCLGCPILVGASRKSFLERIFGWQPEERLHGSLGAAAAAVMAGAQVVRVHDVLETRRVVDTVWAIRHAGTGEHPADGGMEHVRQSPHQHPSE